MCILLLDLGVDGLAFDDRPLTPLDHLARKVCGSFAYPFRVVNTIRALVERGKCQPLLPLTSNAVAFYRGPEEGFAWLYASEYAGVNLEAQDSEGWTLLEDAAFNFGWWTQACVDDPAVCWQSLYLLRAAANPHGMSSPEITPLDAFLRGCTANQVEHAQKWLEVLAKSGVDLHEYAKEELKIHGNEQYLLVSWDEEIWKWTPTNRRVAYSFGETSKDLEIWVEDFDALSWFHCGRHDLDIFQFCTPAESLFRWKLLDARRNDALALAQKEIDSSSAVGSSKILFSWRHVEAVLQTRWFQMTVFSLLLNYAFHLIHTRRQGAFLSSRTSTSTW